MLNKQSLNPFHVAIKSGNSKLVRFILERRSGKIFQDYHPSKATPSGSTPLQFAIESNDSSTIELLVKHATTHDVERCWKQLDMSEDIKEILRTKVCLSVPCFKPSLIVIQKGFVPPGEGLETGQPRGMSKKVQRQQELAQEREARIAEELKRAEMNRQKKEERAAKRAAEKAALEEEELQRKKAAEDEEAERQRQEEIRRAEVRARELEEVKLRAEAEEESRRAEAELRAREIEEAKMRAEAEMEIRRVEAEARARKLEDERLRAEEAKALRLKEEQDARERAEAEARDRAAAVERLRAQKERLEMQRIEQDRSRKAAEDREVQRLEQEMREREERERIEMQKAEIEKTRHRSSEDATARPDMVDVPAGTMSDRRVHGRHALTDEQRREVRRDKQKERKNAKREEQKAAATDAMPQSSPKVKKAKPAVSFHIIRVLSFG
jgi:hypothetical protein